MPPQWEYTDDVNDPCSLCVHWVAYGDDYGYGDAVPYRASGDVAPRVFAGLHDSCSASAIAYGADVEARRARGES